MDRYGSDVLGGQWRTPRPVATQVPAEPGLVVEETDTGWVGAVIRTEKSGGMHIVDLEDRHGRTRSFPLGHGFHVDGQPVELVPPRAAAAAALTAARQATARTASGSRSVAAAPAKVAAASRIFVEGRHDAELVEKVWGDDLRVEGIVVELLDGIDDLRAAITAFAPAPGRRMGVLVDHLVAGSKESRIVADAGRGGGEHLLIVGHPFVDVWQSVRPQRLGLDRWPPVPRHTEWKRGICAALGWPHDDQADIAHAWKRILGTVRSYADLEPAFLGRVEELIDFVTLP